MARVVKLGLPLAQQGIELKSIDAGGGLGIDYHEGPFDAGASVARYAAALNKSLGDPKNGGFDGKKTA